MTESTSIASPENALPAGSSRATWLVAGAIVAAAGAAYAGAFSSPFIFDDLQVITNNPSIHHLLTAFSPPRNGTGVTGRPLVNVSFALDYLAGGEQVWVYHATNIALHVLAALALFGIVRRTFRQTPLRAQFGAAAFGLGAGAALLWTVHPLATESVTCIAQRTELLVGFFYVATFYCFIRALEPEAHWGWRALTLAGCFGGMASKEVMVTAPVLLFLYDRTFVAGSFGAAWRKRRGFYVLLATSWLLLAWLVAGEAGSRGGAEGAPLGSTILAYALTQCRAVMHYLRLVVWPHPLVLDYDTTLVANVSAVWLPGACLLGFVGATVVALRRRPVWGFVGACVFGIVAPSSSFVPLLPQPIAEHRMYLPLAIVLTTCAAVLVHVAGRRARLLVFAATPALALATAARNLDYQSAERIWRDTVLKQPANARAHFYLGYALEEAGRPEPAIASYEAALDRQPDYAEAHARLGAVLGKAGRLDEAIRHLERALASDPRLIVARKNLGLFLSLAGHHAEAVATLTPLVAEHPDDPEAQTWLGDALMRENDPVHAVPHYAAAARIRPGSDKTETNWSGACLLLGQPREALIHGDRALHLNSASVEAHENVGLALVQLGREAEAVPHFRAVLRDAPDNRFVQTELARIETARRRDGR